MTTRGNINGVHSTHQPPHHQPHHHRNHNHHQPQPQPQPQPHHHHNHNHHQPQPQPQPQPQSQSQHPQPQPYPYHQHRSSSSAASFKGCCCCLFLLLTFLVLLFIAVTLFVFLALKPKKPHFDLQQVSVHYLILTSSSSDAATYLSLNISMVFTAANPNKVGIKYSGSDFYVMYKGVPLGMARVPPFYQAAHSVRTVETRVGVDRVDVSMVNAADLVKDATVNDRVELMVVGEIGARIRVMDINSPKVKVSVACAIVISPRKQSLTYKQCGVEGLSV